MSCFGMLLGKGTLWASTKAAGGGVRKTSSLLGEVGLEEQSSLPDPKKPGGQKRRLSRRGALKETPAILAREPSPDQTRQGHLLRITKSVSLTR